MVVSGVGSERERERERERQTETERDEIHCAFATILHQGCTWPGTTWANEVTVGLNHASVAVDRQTNGATIPLCDQPERQRQREREKERDRVRDRDRERGVGVGGGREDK